MSSQPPPPTRSEYDAACRLLGCAPDADSDTLKKSWRRLALEHHPDRAKEADRATATETFAKYSSAWDVVSSVQFRRPPPPVHMGGAFDVFADLGFFAQFSHGGARERAGRAGWRGPPAAGPSTPPIPDIPRVGVSLAQIMAGASLPVSFPGWVHCKFTDRTPHDRSCKCVGTGWVQEGTKDLVVNIPPGVGFDPQRMAGPRPTQLAFSHHGPPNPLLPGEERSTRGPALLEVYWDQVLPEIPLVGASYHGSHRLVGHDLVLHVQVDITQILLGDTVYVIVPWETQPIAVTLGVSILDEGVALLEGRGVPVLNRPGERGQIQIAFAVNTRFRGQAQRDLLTRLRDLRVTGRASSPPPAPTDEGTTDEGSTGETPPA